MRKTLTIDEKIAKHEAAIERLKNQKHEQQILYENDFFVVVPHTYDQILIKTKTNPFNPYIEIEKDGTVYKQRANNLLIGSSCYTNELVRSMHELEQFIQQIQLTKEE